MTALLELIDRKQELSDMTAIPDMRAYAAAWLRLADEFQAHGMVANYGYCKSRGEEYASLAGGIYRRTWQGRSLAEVEPVYQTAESGTA